MCYVCRKDRQALIHETFLPCCGMHVRICGEKCGPLIGRVCDGMSPERYAAKYKRVHLITCRSRLKM